LDLNDPRKAHDLEPAEGRHLGESRQTIRYIGELDVQVLGKIAWEAPVFRQNISNRSEHGHTAVLQLHFSPALEVRDVAASRQTQRVPETDWRLDTSFVLECPNGRVRIQRPVTPGGAGETVLEEHSDDGHHRQSAVCNLRRELLRPQRGVVDGAAEADGSEAKETLSVVSWLGSFFVDYQLNEASEGQNLRPTFLRDHGERLQSIWHVSELQPLRRRQQAGELVVLRHNIADGCEHGNTAMLDLCLAAPFEHFYVLVLAKAKGVPESQRSLISVQTLEATLWLLPFGKGVVARAHQATAHSNACLSPRGGELCQNRSPGGERCSSHDRGNAASGSTGRRRRPLDPALARSASGARCCSHEGHGGCACGTCGNGQSGSGAAGCHDLGRFAAQEKILRSGSR